MAHLTHTIERASWGSYLDGLSETMPKAMLAIEIERESERWVEADGLVFHALTYDPRGDVIEVAGEGGDPHRPEVLRHLIQRPTQVTVDTTNGLPGAILIEDAEGARTLVRLSPVAGLPAG